MSLVSAADDIAGGMASRITSKIRQISEYELANPHEFMATPDEMAAHVRTSGRKSPSRWVHLGVGQPEYGHYEPTWETKGIAKWKKQVPGDPKWVPEIPGPAPIAPPPPPKSDEQIVDEGLAGFKKQVAGFAEQTKQFLQYRIGFVKAREKAMEQVTMHRTNAQTFMLAWAKKLEEGIDDSSDMVHAFAEIKSSVRASLQVHKMGSRIESIDEKYRIAATQVADARDAIAQTEFEVADERISKQLAEADRALSQGLAGMDESAQAFNEARGRIRNATMDAETEADAIRQAADEGLIEGGLMDNTARRAEQAMVEQLANEQFADLKAQVLEAIASKNTTSAVDDATAGATTATRDNTAADTAQEAAATLG
jgi:hypothetical protein